VFAASLGGLECYSLIKVVVQSLGFVVSRYLMKLFGPADNGVSLEIIADHIVGEIWK